MAKLILTHEVTGLGAPGDVVDVKDGYARNYLIPRSLATPWSKGAEKEITAIRRARKTREIATLDDARAVRDSLQASGVTVSAKAGNGWSPVRCGHHRRDRRRGQGCRCPSVDRRKIEVAQPIKALGQYEVQVRLHPEVSAKLKVTVVAA